MWHRVFGHCNPRATEEAQNNPLAHGLKMILQKENKKFMLYKDLVQNAYTKRSEHRAQKIVILLYADICGPFQIAAPIGKSINSHQ